MNDIGNFLKLVGQFLASFFAGIGTTLLSPQAKPVYVGIVALIVIVYTLYEMFMSEKDGKFNRIAAVDIGAFVGLIGAMK